MKRWGIIVVASGLLAGSVMMPVYAATPWMKEDAVGLGATAVGIALVLTVNETAVGILAPVAFITWGAWRTSQLRPQEVKDRIHANLAAKAALPAPGTVGDMLR